jgi:hypothetical protein
VGAVKPESERKAVPRFQLSAQGRFHRCSLRNLQYIAQDKERGGTTMNAKVNSLVLGTAGAIVSAAVMLLLGILGNVGIYRGCRDDDEVAPVLLP